MKRVDKLSKRFKIHYLIIVVVIILFLSIAIPSLARYKNRSSLSEVTVWDGSVAVAYRKGSGTENDPYVISNGAELAYFQQALTYFDYTNTYFVLNNDILLNDGIFSYDKANGIQYTKEGNTRSLSPYLDSYEGINKFKPFDNFKGHFDGNSFTIYGLFITESNADNLGLFTNLEGSIENLYVENSMVYGGNVTSGIASNANNSSISDVIYNGYVVGKYEANDEVISKNISDINKTINNENIEESLHLENIDINNKTISSIKLKGNLEISSENASLMIDNKNINSGNFEIDLGKILKEQLSINYSSTEEVTFNITNLVYEVSLNNGNASGIISSANNVILKNVINKANIYGKVKSAGLINDVNGSLNIVRSYNTGDIYGDNNAAGLISNIENSNENIVISHSYNSGNINAANGYGLISKISNNSQNINISNCFNNNDKYVIGTISESNVVVYKTITTSSNTIKEGTIDGEIYQVDNSILKGYVSDNLEFNRYVDDDNLSSNENNAWIFDNSNLPILYIDDINNPIATINLSKYSWNNTAYSLSTLRFNTSFVFNIESVDNLRPLKNIYYYLSDKALKKSEIESISNWKEYSDVVTVKDEGFYVVYAKVIDYSDNVYYLNSDLLVLDLSPSEVSIKLNNEEWTSLNSNYKNIYLDKENNVTVEAVDSLSGVDTVKYYISEDVLSEEDLDNLDKTKWIEYKDKIEFNKNKLSIIYVKVLDKCNFVTYASTDKLIIDGYKLNQMFVGRGTSVSDESINITNKSSISLNYKYQNDSNYEDGYKHNLISNILLPINTKITLIDNVNSSVYKYEITSSDDNYGFSDNKFATYPFAEFKKIGKGSMDEVFTEYDNSKTINEDYTVILDFENTIILNDISNIKIKLELLDSSDNVVFPTVQKTIKNFNIYSKVGESSSNSTLSISSDTISKFNLNSDSINNLNINTKVIYKKDGDKVIYDSTIEEKSIGIAIKLVDNADNVIAKNYLNNLLFKVGGKSYHPDNDGVIRINLDNGIKDTNTKLTIETFANNTSLNNGNYKFKIGVYSAYDSLYSKNIDYKVEVPVVVSDNNKKINNYNFEVKLDNKSRIIDKVESNTLNFSILYKSNLSNPSIKVSLYKKNLLTAYDQGYTLVDLGEFVNNDLQKYSGSIYNAISNPSSTNNLALNLNTLKFQYGSYKFKFDLYDGDKKVETIEKTVLVK